MSRQTLILLTDGDSVHEWQRRALATLPADAVIHVFACTNTRLKRQVAKHWAYYALNMVSVRNTLTRQVSYGDLDGRVVGITPFESQWDGNWQRLPDDIVAQMAAIGADAVIKFGMGLMRVPEALTLPILSYHHGDPDHYRGRPAAFYEMAEGTPFVGQIVQSISNTLDAGEILAFAETRVLRHSWRATLVEAFRHSPLLLNQALANAASGSHIAKARKGRNYRLPSNGHVLAHVWRTSRNMAKRLLYGICAEKHWRVSLVAVEDALALATSAAPFPPMATWQTLPTPAGFSFLADPFFAPSGAVLAEALDAATGRGALLYVGDDRVRKISQETGHHSYPFVIGEDGVDYCIPEIADWSVPLVYPLLDGGQALGAPSALDLPDASGLTDPTFVRHQGRLWLFANRKVEGSNVLRLWSAESLFARFTEHPQSPIRISPNGGRMAGNILLSGGQLYRLGQDFEADYGDGISVFAIDRLDQETYAERRIGGLRFTECRGPHSFNLSADGKTCVFDWYVDRYTPMAGVRRLRARLKI